MRLPSGIRTTHSSRKQTEGGYILITLMLFVALLVIASLVALQELKFEVRRDREEELVHRGVQYARGVKRYYKKFGTYPSTLEALENTQNMRFLRKRYKDPVTNQDFKILRMTDVHMMVGATGLPGAQGLQGLAGALNGGLNGALGQNAAAAQAQLANMAVTQAALGANNANPFSNSTQDNGNGQNSGSGNNAGAGNAPADPNSPGSANNSGSGQPGSNSNSPFVSASGQSTGNSFGGAPIVGVVSTSKKETIRVFAKKNHYNDWQFIYDLNSDRGGLLNSPVQPNLQQSLNVPTQNGQNGTSPNSGSSSPFSNSFGNNQNGSNSSFGGNNNNSGNTSSSPQN
jgi:type II secretory pathway pseudopilin PulG